MTPQVIAGIDPRSFSTERLEPPEPLPLVSRKALRRVKHYIQPLTECHHCNGKVSLAHHRQVYQGRSYGEWPYLYLCESCGAYVGLHPHTDLPLGFLATASDRAARTAAKLPFATLVRAHFKERHLAYAWLAGEMKIEPRLCHFSMFDEEECIRVFEICFDKLFEI